MALDINLLGLDLALKANKINVMAQRRQVQSMLGKLAKALKLLR